MLSIHRFTGKAEGYAKYRPQYPIEFIEYLISCNGLTAESAIADVGSGTGILTGQLLEHGMRVFAVEPNADMRKIAEQNLSTDPRFVSFQGTAENTALSSGSVDLVTAAQAFHWFNPAGFKQECRRILKPGGKVALVWNIRDSSSPLTSDIDAVCKAFCPNYVGTGGGIEGNTESIKTFYQEFEYRTFQNDTRYRLDDFIGRLLSVSDAPKESDPNYSAFIQELTKLFERHCVESTLVMPQTARSWLGSV